MRQRKIPFNKLTRSWACMSIVLAISESMCIYHPTLIITLFFVVLLIRFYPLTLWWTFQSIIDTGCKSIMEPTWRHSMLFISLFSCADWFFSRNFSIENQFVSEFVVLIFFFLNLLSFCASQILSNCFVLVYFIIFECFALYLIYFFFSLIDAVFKPINFSLYYWFL